MTSLETHDQKVATPGSTGDNSHALDGIWNKSAPTTTTSDSGTRTTDTAATLNPAPDVQVVPGSSKTDSRAPLASETNTPIFTDSDGRPISDAKVAGMSYTGFNNKTGAVEMAAMVLPKFPSVERSDAVTPVSDRTTTKSAGNHPTASELSRVAHDAVGSDQFGNKVPASARENANFEVPTNLKCASTSSEWMVKIGMMTNREFKIKVADLVTLLPQKGFRQVPLSGNFDASKFPDGPIGFITGQGAKDGSNHIGFVEKRDGQVRVVHNDYHTGRVVDQNITEKFYTPDGKPKYNQMNLFIFPRKNS